MTASLSIDRTSLALGALVVPATGYELGEDFAPGGMVWARTFAASRFVDDAALTSARRETTSLAGTIRVVGTSAAVLQTREAALRAALSQFSYTITWAEGATVYTWSCWPADMVPSALVAEQRDVFVQEFAVAVPRASVPVAGSF